MMDFGNPQGGFIFAKVLEKKPIWYWRGGNGPWHGCQRPGKKVRRAIVE